MDIGQALAMMRYANQARDYQNQLNSQPNIDWRDIASQPVDYYGSEQGAMTPPVANYIPSVGEPSPFDFQQVVAGYEPEPTPVVQGYVPPTGDLQGYVPMQGEIPSYPAYAADATFSELYGQPSQTSGQFAPSPYAPTGYVGGYGSYGGQPSAQLASLPPLPIPGATQPRATVTARPPQALTDIPQEMQVEPGATVAMLEEPAKQTVPEQKPAQVETWAPGKPFEMTIGGKKAVVNNFIPAKPDETPRPATVTFPELGGRTVQYPVGSPQYQEIMAQYESKIQRPEDDGVYNSRVRVQMPDATGKFTDQWVPARIDAATNKIYYKDPQLDAELVYGDKKITEVTEEDFLGPLDSRGLPDNSQLAATQQRSMNPLQNRIDAIIGMAGGYRGGDSPEYIAQTGLIGTLTEGTADEPTGSIEWKYQKRDGSIVTLDEAAKEGLVPNNLPIKVAEAENRAKAFGIQASRGALAAQTAKAQDLTERDLEQAERGIKAMTELIAKTEADANITDKERAKLLKDYKKRLADLEQKKLDLTTRVGSSQKIAGGGTVYQSTPDTTAFTVDPTSQLGVMTLLAGGNAVPNPNLPAQTIKPFTDEEYIRMIANAAVAKTNPYAISDQPDMAWVSATAGLTDRLAKIQQDALEASDKYGKEPIDFLNQPAEFVYLNENNMKVTKTMPLNVALEELESASTAYKLAAASGDAAQANAAKQRLAEAARPFGSGVIRIAYDKNDVVSYPASLQEMSMRSVQYMFARPPVLDMSLQRDITVTPATRVAEAAKDVVVAPPSTGSNRPPQPIGSYAYPLYLDPGTQKYIRADAGFNVFDRIGTSEQAYVRTGTEFQTKDSASRQASDMMMRAMFVDGGGQISKDATKLAAANDAINKFNEKLKDPSPEGRKLRQAASNVLYNMTGKIGFQINAGESGVSAAFENIFLVASKPGATDAEIQKAIDDAMAVWRGPGDAVNQQRMAKTVAGKQSIDLAAAGNAQYKAAIPNSSTKLYDNIQQAWYELALLFAALGKKGTGYTIPHAYTTLKMAYNSADPSAGGFGSPLTLPSSMTGEQKAVLNYQTAKTGSAANADTDPAYAGFMMNSSNIFGSDYGTLSAGMEKSADQVVKAAKDNYQDLTKGTNNLKATSQQREDVDLNAPWHSTTNSSTANMFNNAVWMGVVFGGRRNRNTYNRATGGFPKFSSGNVKP